SNAPKTPSGPGTTARLATTIATSSRLGTAWRNEFRAITGPEGLALGVREPNPNPAVRANLFSRCVAHLSRAQQAATDARLSPSTMILRQAAPLQVSPFGIELLPPNQARLRLELVQLMPTGPPSASFATSVTHGNFARPLPTRECTWKPMKLREGAA